MGTLSVRLNAMFQFNIFPLLPSPPFVLNVIYKMFCFILEHISPVQLCK